jgi:Tfp pilus tip-associated adhesin PilY1
VGGNGLSTPIAVDVDYDRKVDYVYAGDLMGNLWKFDLTADDAGQWRVAYGSSTVPQPLFQAKDENNDPQPITTRPEVSFHPKEHGYMVYFGTGKFLENGDPDDTQLQTVYGVWDFGDYEDEYLGSLNRTTNALSGPKLASTVMLLEQTEDTKFKTQLAGRTIRTLTNHPIDWEVQPDQDSTGTLDDPVKHAGWYFDLPIAKERVVTDVTLRDGKVIVIGFTPTSNDCQGGGTSMLMEIDWESGGRLAGVNFDVTDDGEINEEDETEEEDDETKKAPPTGVEFAGMIQRPAILLLNEEIEQKFMSSSDGTIKTIKEKAAKLGVSYWMEVHPD